MEIHGYDHKGIKVTEWQKCVSVNYATKGFKESLLLLASSSHSDFCSNQNELRAIITNRPLEMLAKFRN